MALATQSKKYAVKNTLFSQFLEKMRQVMSENQEDGPLYFDGRLLIKANVAKEEALRIEKLRYRNYVYSSIIR